MSKLVVREKQNTEQEFDAWDIRCGKNPVMSFLLESGNIQINEANPEAYFNVHILGEDVSSPKNSVILFHDYEDDGAAITGAIFEFIPRDEFEKNYEVDRKVLFDFGIQNEYEVFLKDRKLWYINQADQTGFNVDFTKDNLSKIMKMAEKDSENLDRVEFSNDYFTKLQEAQANVEKLGLSASNDLINEDIDLDK